MRLRALPYGCLANRPSALSKRPKNCTLPDADRMTGRVWTAIDCLQKEKGLDGADRKAPFLRFQRGVAT